MNKKTFPNLNYTFNNQNVLNDLPIAISDLLFKRSTNMSFKAGAYIFEEGNAPEGIYRVISGKVKKSTLTTFGTEHIFYVCKELDYLGYHALLSDENYSDSAAALTDCEIAFINKADFLKAVEKSHLLTQRLLKNLSHEFVVYINATKALAKYTVRERTALNLLILEDKFGDDAGTKTSITISNPINFIFYCAPILSCTRVAN